MSFKHVVSNSALVLAAEIFERLMRLALVVFSARLLGDTDYGKFTFALSFTSLFLILADGGVHQLMVREIARHPEKGESYLANGLSIKIVLSLLTVLCFYFFGWLTRKPDDVLLTVMIIGLSQICMSFSEFFTSVFRAHQKMGYEVISTLMFGVVNTGLGIAILLMGANFVVLAYIYLLAQIVRLIYCIWITQARFAKIRLMCDPGEVKFLLTEGLPFGIMYFFALMYTYIDSTMLSLMIGDEVVGWYSAAYRLVFAMMFIPVGLMKAVFPALSLYYKESLPAFKNLFERTFKVMFIVGFSLASLICLLAERIIVFIFGEEYINATGALQILVWSTAIIFIGTVQTHTTRSANQQRYTAKVVASSALLNLILNFILIPRYTLYGAALSTLASELFTFVLHFRYLVKLNMVPPFFHLAPKVVAINLVMILAIIVLGQAHLFIIIPAAFIVNALMLLATQYFSRNEIQFALAYLKLSKGSSISR